MLPETTETMKEHFMPRLAFHTQDEVNAVKGLQKVLHSKGIFLMEQV